jgi:hypothetical protein
MKKELKFFSFLLESTNVSSFSFIGRISIMYVGCVRNIPAFYGYGELGFDSGEGA